jgi:hypothetical protein
MDTPRADILNQLAAGQISATEAAQRLGAPPKANEPSRSASAHWLRVRVTDLETGKLKVNVNVPLAWVKVGMRIGATHKPELAGIDFNEIVEQIHAGASGKLVEVEDIEDGERVEVYVD